MNTPNPKSSLNYDTSKVFDLCSVFLFFFLRDSILPKKLSSGIFLQLSEVQKLTVDTYTKLNMIGHITVTFSDISISQLLSVCI